jgi:hypothetical protein
MILSVCWFGGERRDPASSHCRGVAVHAEDHDGVTGCLCDECHLWGMEYASKIIW